jgi:hypothetical protein
VVTITDETLNDLTLATAEAVERTIGIPVNVMSSKVLQDLNTTLSDWLARNLGVLFDLDKPESSGSPARDAQDEWDREQNIGPAPVHEEPEADLTLCVSFEPQAIRDHFEGLGEADPTSGLTDEQLKAIGEYAIHADSLWSLFHELLQEAVDEQVWRPRSAD